MQVNFKARSIPATHDRYGRRVLWCHHCHANNEVVEVPQAGQSTRVFQCYTCRNAVATREAIEDILDCFPLKKKPIRKKKHVHTKEGMV